MNVSRTLSQRNYIVKKSQKSLSTVASLTKKKVAQGTRGSLRKHKYAIRDDNTKRKYVSVDQNNGDAACVDGEEEIDGHVNQHEIVIRVDSAIQSADRLGETPLCHDYERVGLGSVTKLVPGSPWRLSMVNLNYTICRRLFFCHF